MNWYFVSFCSPGFGVFLIIIGIAIAKFKLIDTIPDESIEEAYKNFAEANFEKARGWRNDESMLIQIPIGFGMSMTLRPTTRNGERKTKSLERIHVVS